MRTSNYVAAYFDDKEGVFYTIYERTDGTVSIYKLIDNAWVGVKQGVSLVCKPTTNVREAEAVLKQYIRDLGLPAFKANYNKEMFPNPERIKLEPIRRK